MIYNSVGASRRVAGVVAAVGAPLLAMLAAGLSNPASAGSGGAHGPNPKCAGPYCDESDEAALRLEPGARGSKAISRQASVSAPTIGSADARGPFAPIDEPGVVGARSSSGFVHSLARRWAATATWRRRASGDIAALRPRASGRALPPKTPPRQTPARPSGPTGLRNARSNAAPARGRFRRSPRGDEGRSSRPRLSR